MKKPKCLPIPKKWQVLQVRGVDRDKATGTIEWTTKSSLQDFHTGWPTEVEWYFCSPLCQETFLSLERLENCDINVATLRVFNEKKMKHFIGARCFQSYAAISKKMSEISRIHNGWIECIEEATRKDFSSAWTRTIISSTFLPSSWSHIAG